MMRILDNFNRRLLMATIAVVSLGSAWSYGDEMLLIGRGQTVWAVNPDGTALRTVLEGAPLVVSPNGQWIIVERPTRDKEVVDLESGAIIASLGRFVRDLSWSPDSEWIAFQRGGHLFMVRRDGSEEKVIVDADELGPFLGSPYSLSFSAIAPKWDPLNPQYIYFNVLFGGNAYHIGVVDVDSGDLRMVSPQIGWHLLNVHSPFSPDGRQLLMSDCGDGTHCIKVLDLATGEVIGPGWNGADHSSASWSPDGTQVAFSVADGRGGLHVAEVAGQSTRQLVPGGGDAAPGGPVWSQAGDVIAFCMVDWTGAGGHEIYVIRPDGSGLRKVADGDQVLWWTEASEEQPTYMRLKTWGTIKQDSR